MIEVATAPRITMRVFANSYEHAMSKAGYELGERHELCNDFECSLITVHHIHSYLYEVTIEFTKFNPRTLYGVTHA